jgi:LacI family transcriptional regulator
MRDMELSVVAPGQEVRDNFRFFDPGVLILAGDFLDRLSAEDRRGRVIVGCNTDLSRSGYLSVLPDDRAIGREAANYFLGRGIKSLAAFTVEGHPFANEREAGFLEVAKANGAQFHRWETPAGDNMMHRAWRERMGTEPPAVIPEHLARQFNDAHSSERIKWIRSLPQYTGIFGFCDSWTVWLSQECRYAGVRVPEDIPLLGADDDKLQCELARPALSSIIVPWVQLGSEAARAAADLIDGTRKPPRRGQPGEVIRIGPIGVQSRRSSDMLAVTDPQVREALIQIQSHADRPFTVSELLRRVPADRRVLERNFRLLVGRTMRAEIRRVHVEHAKRLLTGTELTMPEVAEQSGFTQASKLSSLFKSETGITPTEYRRKFRVKPF